MGFWDQVQTDVAAIAASDGAFEAITCNPENGVPFASRGVFGIGADLGQYDGNGQAVNATVSIPGDLSEIIEHGGTITQAKTGYVWRVGQLMTSNQGITTLTITRDQRLGL